MMDAVRLGVSWAGLFVGPVAWAISTQVNYALVNWQCQSRLPLVAATALLLALAALSAGILSARALRVGGTSQRPGQVLRRPS